MKRIVNKDIAPYKHERLGALLAGIVTRSETMLSNDKMNEINNAVLNQKNIDENIFGMGFLCERNKKKSFILKWKVTKMFPWRSK